MRELLSQSLQAYSNVSAPWCAAARKPDSAAAQTGLLQKKQELLAGPHDRTPVRDMTLRQLRETVQNLQFRWVKTRAAETMQPSINNAVHALFHRCVDREARM